MIEEIIEEDLILEKLHEDEKKIRNDERKIKIAFLGIAILFVIIIAGIFYFFSIKPSGNQNSAEIVVTQSLSPTQSINPSPSKPPPSPTPVIILKEIDKSSSIKEYFIPFGTGTNQTSDWADVPGLQANVDFGSYQNIKDIRFEVSVNIPTGNQTASVRLFNVTDKHPVWNSEVTTTSDVYKVSPSLIYDKGAKTYQVQMKTQLKFLANLTLARIHITMN